MPFSLSLPLYFTSHVLTDQCRIVFRGNEPLQEILVIGIDSVPPSLKNWINREDIQENLHYQIKNNSHLIGIVGVGGFGKSSLAAWAFQNLASGFQKALWIKLPREIPFSQFARWILQEIGYKVAGDHHSDQDLALELLRRLRERSYLVVIDQLEVIALSVNWASYKAFLLDWFNRGEFSTVLFTTKQQVCEANSWIYLHGLERIEVSEILKQSDIVNHNSICVERLKIATDGHPLLINLVIAWLKLSKEYLGQLELTLEDVYFFENLFQDFRLYPEIKVKEVFKALFKQLSSELRTLLTSISVYRSSFTLEEVQAVITKATETDLQILSGKALLLTYSQDNRWALHPLIQQLVYEELELLNRSQLAHHNAGKFFSANIIEKKVTPEDCELEMESFYHFCKAKSYIEAGRILANCSDFLNRYWGGFGLLIPLWQQLICEQVKDDLLPENKLKLALSWIYLGDAFHSSLKNSEEAVSAYQKANYILIDNRNSFDEKSCILVKIHLMHRLGRVYCSLGKYQEDVESNQEALNLSKDIADKKYEFCSIKNLGSAIYNLYKINLEKSDEKFLDSYFTELSEKYPREYEEFVNIFCKKIVAKRIDSQDDSSHFVRLSAIAYEEGMVLGDEDMLMLNWHYGRYIIDLKATNLF
jgi:tetratricopeptide (TPR) repeat protein